MTEITNTPDLRFPEFNDKWQRMNLSNIVTTIKGNDNQIDLPILTISAKYGWLTQKERFSQVIAGNSLKRYTKVSRGDLSYNKGNSKIAKYGIVYKMNYDEALVPNVYKSFRPHKGINSSFIEKYFHTKKLDRQLRKYISSTARMDGLLNISDNDFYKVNIYIPNSFEQEKIGDFFNKLDQQIELEEKKLELLEQQKRGYMQKIFSQQLRFKDENGNDYPEWKKRKLDDVANYRRGSFPQPYGNKEWYDEKNGEPFVQVVDVDKNMKLHDKTKQKISDLAKPKSVKGFKGDIVVTLQGSIGRVAILQYDAYIDRTLLLINSFKIKMNKNYFNYVLYLLFLREKERAPGGTIKTITKAVLSNFEIDIPTLEEQNKIGMFFNEIDNLIELQNNKINHLKQRKQGLLQKMFV
ncbi:restriction endonuclease subunit S [Staphylococcus hominis]|uniref:restriction endonuclease subunit S n=2 Tax=Staphylococcus TaxID=1279 RepID=UPI0009BF0AE0|nr:restriction endonuclease subunit S [Staphylococcus hominis]